MNPAPPWIWTASRAQSTAAVLATSFAMEASAVCGRP